MPSLRVAGTPSAWFRGRSQALLYNCWGEVDLSLQGLASMQGERTGRDDIRIVVKSSLLYRLSGIGSDVPTRIRQ